jgi:hypothetical protein
VIQDDYGASDGEWLAIDWFEAESDNPYGGDMNERRSFVGGLPTQT